jgi:small subunit ribosomal protein S20
MNEVGHGQRGSALTVLDLPSKFPRSRGGPLPRIESAKKAMRQARSRGARNRAQRSALRTALKHVREATAAGAKEAYATAVRLLDRAARKRLIHPNNAARHKSRLAAHVRKLAS